MYIQFKTEADKMIYTFIGVLIAAVVIGTAIGAACIFGIMKCCKNDQK